MATLSWPCYQLLAGARSGDLLSVKRILSCGAHPDMRNDKGLSALHKASQKGQLSVLKFLIQHRNSPPIDHIDHAGRSSLLFAALNGRSAAVKILLGAGANIDAQDQHGQSAINLAMKFKFLSVVTELVDHSVQPNVTFVDRRDGFDPLMWAAKNGMTFCAESILKCDSPPPNIRAKCKAGLTALDLAKRYKNRRIETLILEYTENLIANSVRSSYEGLPECLILLVVEYSPVETWGRKLPDDHWAHLF